MTLQRGARRRAIIYFAAAARSLSAAAMSTASDGLSIRTAAGLVFLALTFFGLFSSP